MVGVWLMGGGMSCVDCCVVWWGTHKYHTATLEFPVSVPVSVSTFAPRHSVSVCCDRVRPWVACCCLLAEVPVLNWDVALRLGRFLPFESRSFTTIHTLFTSKPVVVNSGLLL